MQQAKPRRNLKKYTIPRPNKSPSVTPYKKADIRNGYVIPQESQVYRKSEKYENFRKQKWFGAVHPNVQIDAKLDYMIQRVLVEMNQTSLSIYKKIWRSRSQFKTDRFYIVNTKIFISGIYRHRTAKHICNTNVFSLIQFKTVSSLHYVLENQCFERIPVFYQSNLQFVDQVTRKIIRWPIKAPYKKHSYDQQI